jgi:hypothetical protein
MVFLKVAPPRLRLVLEVRGGGGVPIRPASSTFHIDGENEEKLSTWVVKWRGGRVKRCVAKFFTGIWVKDHF